MRLAKKVAIILVAVCGFLWLTVDVDPVSITTISGSEAFFDAKGRMFHVRLSDNGEWQIPVRLNEMGKWLPLVAVNTEDGRFFRHVGIDALALLRAIVQDTLRLRKVSGASTITAQVIRLRVSEKAGRKRTPSTKIREFIAAMKLERQASKEQILECYLNSAPFGGNIRGVEAASRIYFGKSAGQISPGEACLLIGMLKGPSVYRPDLHPSSALLRRNEIIRLMERKHVFTHDEARRAYLEELPSKKFALPSRAWHFTELVLAQSPVRQAKYHTTLNLAVQSKIEALLRQALGEFPGNVTVSCGVVDNDTGSVIAWCGNARFSYGDNWVDCGRSLRSPGSTLKPFVYLAAIERGELTPSTLLADTSHAFGGRAPRNFDLSYHGAVTARTALHESLNVPAVRVMRMIGADRVLSLLRVSGYRHIKNGADYYGDSLVLGGCEVSLLEQLEAYTALASLGVHRPLKVLKDTVQVGERIASEAGCYMVSDMLRYDGEYTGGIKLSVKTGTSYGFRDAWACSWTRDYTVCVWAGIADGSSWPGLVGARACTPIALRIMRVLPTKAGWYERPDGVIMREVCALSGKPPTALCPSTKQDYAIEGVTHTTPCDVHKVNRVDMPEGFTLQGRKNTPLKIVSPIAGASYFNAANDTERKIPLKVEGARGKVYWYIDGEYIAEGYSLLRGMTDGEHIVSVGDEYGRSDSVRMKVYTPGKRQVEEKLF